LPGYEKTRNFYVKPSGNDIYAKLKPLLKVAINNAKANKSFDFKNTNNGISQMNLFYEADKLKDYFKPLPTKLVANH